MSFTDPSAQPEGQGGDEPSGPAPYQQYLEEIPEEHRGLVEPAFRRWDGDVTRRFQEAAQIRDQFAPFQQHGLHEYDPEGLAQLVQWAQMAEDPEQFKSWLQQQAQRHGLLEQQQQQQTDPADDVYSDDPAFQAALRAALGPLQQELEELRGFRSQTEQWREQQDLTTYESEAQAEIDQHLDQLAREHGEAFDRNAVEMFLPRHIDDAESATEAIDKAFADYRQIAAQIEQQFVSRKTGQPTPPVVPGAANASKPAVLSKDEAREAALAMVRQGNRA